VYNHSYGSCDFRTLQRSFLAFLPLWCDFQKHPSQPPTQLCSILHRISPFLMALMALVLYKEAFLTLLPSHANSSAPYPCPTRSCVKFNLSPCSSSS
jgi:hypothetical protein